MEWCGRVKISAWRSRSVAVAAIAISVAPAFAEMQRGSYSYATLEQCVDAGQLGDALCANAVANAEAEFDEKAPRFSTRRECEARFGAGRCELGLAGAGGWSGKRQGIFFMPRQSGFRVTVRSEADMTVVPTMLGRELGFGARSILRLQTGRSGKFRQEAQPAWRNRGVAFGQPPGAPQNAGASRPLPPPPPFDPSFDCSSLLEPSADKPASTGCYPAPSNRLRR
jgi:uncharacterized protein YgiB involved in biofilm formation